MRLARLAIPLASLASLAFAVPGLARADDGKPPEKSEKPEKKDKPVVVEVEKGPQIAWARSWDEAVQEAAERNMPILVHSHART